MRKILALIMVVAMMATLASVVFAEDKTVSATYTFDEGKADAGLTENGENFTYADGAVTFGAGSWFLSDLDLTGAKSITVTMKVKVDPAISATAWLFDISTEETHVYKSEHYIGALIDQSNGFALVSESYNSSNVDRPVNLNVGSISGDDFVTVVFQYNEDGSKSVSINGAEAVVDPQDAGHDLAVSNCIGDKPTVKIGHAVWGEEYAVGVTIDEISIEAVIAGGEDVPPTSGGDDVAPPTGFATIALAIAAIGSGAYIVSKKH